jgi:NADH:ubiquinone oxidoreductase subunit 2 (subunit N)
MLFILNNLVLPLSFNYQQFLLFFGEFFLLVMLLFFLLDIANPKFEIMPSQRLTSFTLKLSNRVSNTLILTFGLILINAMPRKDLIFSDSINISKTTCWLFFDKIATDLYTSAIKLLILFSSILILKFSHGFIVELHKVENNLELPLLLGFATFFLLILTSTMDLVVLGLTMEGLSLTLYVLINVNLH